MWHFVLVRDNPVVKKSSKSRAVVVDAKLRAEAKLPVCAAADYQILNDKQLEDLHTRLREAKAARKKKGQAKAAETRKKNGTKPHFILCPTCDGKSKLLRTEMGGLQTRECKKGHLFEVDMYFGFESGKRRIEQFDRPFFSPTGGNYNDWVVGKFKDDPTGKGER